METKFVCENLDEMLFEVEGEQLRLSECEVLSEESSKISPMLVLVLKSQQGSFAEVTITSNNGTAERASIRGGSYEGKIYDEETAKTFAAYALAFSKKS